MNNNQTFQELNNKNIPIYIAIHILYWLILIVIGGLLMFYKVNSKDKTLLSQDYKFFIFILFIIFSVHIIDFIKYLFTNFELYITIKEKITMPAYNRGAYRIVDTNNNIFEIRDVWFFGDFNTANDYVMLKEGKTYKMYGFGARINFMSNYPIVYKFEEA